MAIPKLKGFLTEDFKEAPAWFQKFLVPLNEYMTTVTNALQGRISKSEHLLAYDEDFDFTTETIAANTFPLRFKGKLRGNVRPTDVHVSQIYKHNGVPLSTAYSISWVFGDTGEIEVTFQGLENSTRYKGKLSFSA